MEEQKLIQRYHGGAKALAQLDTADDNGNYEFDLTRVPRGEEKKRIGDKACEFLKNDDIIFMNSGSTVLFFQEAIRDKHVTVVTIMPGPPSAASSREWRFSAWAEIIWSGPNPLWARSR